MEQARQQRQHLVTLLEQTATILYFHQSLLLAVAVAVVAAQTDLVLLAVLVAAAQELTPVLLAILRQLLQAKAIPEEQARTQMPLVAAVAQVQ